MHLKHKIFAFLLCFTLVFSSVVDSFAFFPIVASDPYSAAFEFVCAQAIEAAGGAFNEQSLNDFLDSCEDENSYLKERVVSDLLRGGLDFKKVVDYAGFDLGFCYFLLPEIDIIDIVSAYVAYCKAHGSYNSDTGIYSYEQTGSSDVLYCVSQSEVESVISDTMTDLFGSDLEFHFYDGTYNTRFQNFNYDNVYCCVIYRGIVGNNQEFSLLWSFDPIDVSQKYSNGIVRFNKDTLIQVQAAPYGLGIAPNAYDNYRILSFALSPTSTIDSDIGSENPLFLDIESVNNHLRTAFSRPVTVHGTDSSETSEDMIQVSIVGRATTDSNGVVTFEPVSAEDAAEEGVNADVDSAISAPSVADVVVQTPSVTQTQTGVVSVTGFKSFADTVKAWLSAFFDRLAACLRSVFIPDTAVLSSAVTDLRIRIQNTFGVQMFDFNDLWGSGGSERPPDIVVPYTVGGVQHSIVILSFRYVDLALQTFRRLLRAVIMLWLVVYNLNQFFRLIGAGSLSSGRGDVGDSPSGIKEADWRVRR